jgi:hypothetical protein
MKSLSALLVSIIALCAPVMGATFSGDLIKGTQSASLIFVNEIIPTSSYLEKTFYGIGGFNSIVFNVGAVSAGSIATANVDWFIQSGGIPVTINQSVEHAGRAITDVKSDVVRIRLNSNQAD